MVGGRNSNSSDAEAEGSKKDIGVNDGKTRSLITHLTAFAHDKGHSRESMAAAAVPTSSFPSPAALSARGR